WRTPLAPQGPAPARFSPVEASLAAEACGSCHPAQFADWRTSLHAQAMGPGVAGQLVEMLTSAPADALGCHTCHAPLAEQRPLLGTEERHARNPAFDPALRAHGLICAGCHVRAHERFGPARRDGAGVPRGGTVTATLRMTSTRVGHAFPTYVTPRVILRGELVDETGAVIAGTRVQRIVAREVALDLSREVGDTRLAPGRSVELRYARRVDRDGLRLRFTVVV